MSSTAAAAKKKAPMTQKKGVVAAAAAKKRPARATAAPKRQAPSAATTALIRKSKAALEARIDKPARVRHTHPGAKARRDVAKWRTGTQHDRRMMKKVETKRIADAFMTHDPLANSAVSSLRLSKRKSAAAIAMLHNVLQSLGVRLIERAGEIAALEHRQAIKGAHIDMVQLLARPVRLGDEHRQGGVAHTGPVVIF